MITECISIEDIYLLSSIALTLALNSSVILFTVGFTISSMAWPDASLLPLSPPPSRLSSSDSMSSSSLLPRLLLLRLDLSESDSEVESRRFLCLRRLRSESLSPLLECRLLLSFLRLFLWRDLDRDLDRRFLFLSRLLLLDFRFLFFGLSSSESEERSTTALAGTKEGVLLLIIKR